MEARTSRWRCRSGNESRCGSLGGSLGECLGGSLGERLRGCLGRPLLLLLLLGGCASAPPKVDQTGPLLGLINRVIEATSAEERRGVEENERQRFDTVPTYDNMLRLALVRAFSAALPAELMETRNDLATLADGHQELTDEQRYLAKMALIMVDQRLQMGAQITDLQRQIDSLTAIEASLKDNDVTRPPEPKP